MWSPTSLALRPTIHRFVSFLNSKTITLEFVRSRTVEHMVTLLYVGYAQVLNVKDFMIVADRGTPVFINMYNTLSAV